MCGIAGTFDLRPGLPDPERLVATMTDLLAHRGPDDAGLLLDPPVALGHRRLAILDLSPDGHGPMASHDGALWLTYNGEIYNYLELADELRALGHELRSSCDTEVLLLAYEQWGIDALRRLNGMFAFALWDRRRGQLLCVRDRFGVKPFYYAVAGGRFRFASEIKALLLDPEVPRVPNDARVLDFLAFGLADHTEETMFRGVLQLQPGTYLRIDDRGVGRPVSWYVPRPAPLDSAEAAGELRSRLRDAVELRLRSDVPVGIALSGGLDSGAVVALAAATRREAGLEPPLTFSAHCADPRADEAPFVDRVTATVDVRNVAVLPTGDELLADLDSLVWHMDEPFHGPSIYGQRRVHALAREHGIVVLLDGQGGDEVLSGYHHFHYRALLLDLARRGRLGTLLGELRARRRLHGVSAFVSAKEVVKALARRPPAVPSWLAADCRPEPPPLPHPSLDGHRRHGIDVVPLPAWNHHADRNSMSVSLEARSPFLDYRVVECGLALAAEDLLREGFTKWALREAVRDLLPPEVVDRARKQGFSTDEALWFREGLGDVLERTFRSERTAALRYFDVPALLRTLEGHRAGSDRSLELWRAYSVVRWLEVFIDPPRLIAPGPAPARHAVDTTVRPASVGATV